MTSRAGNATAVLRTTLIVVGVLASLYVAYLLRRPIAWLAIALFVALALAPPVRLLSRWMRRGFAIALVYVGLLLVPIGLALVVVPPVVTQVQHFVDDAPRYAADVRDFIENNRTLRRLQEEYDLGGQLQAKAAELPSKVGSAASLLAGLGIGLVNSVLAVVTILVLAAFMLAGGPRWRDGVLSALPVEQAAAWRRVSDDIAGAVGNYVGGALAQAVIAGASSYVVMLILGIPFSGPLAVLIAVLDLIPLIGATIGAMLVAIVSVFVGFPAATVIWGIWAIVYQQVENNVIQPRIQSRAVDVQPFIVLVAVLFGGALFGIIGALMAAPAAASAQIVIREVVRQRRDLRTATHGTSPLAATGRWGLDRMATGQRHCEGVVMSRLADPFVLGPGVGERIQNAVGGPVTFKLRGEQSNGQLTVFENLVPSGEGPPLHVHTHEHECIYVLAGELRVQFGERFGRAAAGSFVFIPRGTGHCFQNIAPDDARVLVMFTPAGMEQFFERFAVVVDRMTPDEAYRIIGREVGMKVIGPPLPDYRDGRLDRREADRCR